VREEKEKKRKGKGSVAALRDLASGLSRACAVPAWPARPDVLFLSFFSIFLFVFYIF
jgi:hypothetical protein